MKKPNIVYIHSHDTGRYIEPYGYAVKTPNLRNLAEEGLMFRQAYSTSPTCSPSRASLLTGYYPHNNGMLGLAHRGFSLGNYNHHIIHTLKKVGYTTVLAGVQHIASGSSPWQTIGYDMCLEEIPDHVFSGDWEDNLTHKKACEYFDNSPKEPFFISIGFTETHRMFPSLSKTNNSSYTSVPCPLPDTPEVREDLACFKSSVNNLDKKIGEVIDALKRNNLYNNTLIICTTDHGLPFPKMKCTLTGHGIGVMLIISWPDYFQGGKVFDCLVSQIDIYPTICDLLGIEHPDWLEGNSLVPVFEGKQDEVREEVFSEVTFHAAYEPIRSIRTKRWNYIKRFGDRLKPVLPNVDDSPTKDLLLHYDFAEQTYDKESLYDLINDPCETNNLINEATHLPILNNLRMRLDNWMKKTNDPLIHGYVEVPQDVVLDDPDSISPS